MYVVVGDDDGDDDCYLLRIEMKTDDVPPTK